MASLEFFRSCIWFIFARFRCFHRSLVNLLVKSLESLWTLSPIWQHWDCQCLLEVVGWICDSFQNHNWLPMILGTRQFHLFSQWYFHLILLWIVNTRWEYCRYEHQKNYEDSYRRLTLSGLQNAIVGLQNCFFI